MYYGRHILGQLVYLTPTVLSCKNTLLAAKVSNCAWLLLLHATAVDGLVQICTQKYITSRQRGVRLHPPFPLKSATVLKTFHLVYLCPY